MRATDCGRNRRVCVYLSRKQSGVRDRFSMTSVHEAMNEAMNKAIQLSKPSPYPPRTDGVLAALLASPLPCFAVTPMPSSSCGCCAIAVSVFPNEFALRYACHLLPLRPSRYHSWNPKTMVVVIARGLTFVPCCFRAMHAPVDYKSARCSMLPSWPSLTFVSNPSVFVCADLLQGALLLLQTDRRDQRSSLLAFSDAVSSPMRRRTNGRFFSPSSRIFVESTSPCTACPSCCGIPSVALASN